MRGVKPMKVILSSAAWSRRQQTELEETGLHPARQFCAIVDRERALVDRNDHSFALLVFDVSEYSRTWQKIMTFAKVAAARLRKTDMMGWTDDGHTGVLLPFTNIQGAKRVAREITRELAKSGINISCVVHTYPAEDRHDRPGAKQLSLLGMDGGAPPSQGGEPPATSSASMSAAHGDRIHTAPHESHLKAMILPPFPRWKRVMDIFFSLLLLILAAPLMLVIAALIKVVSPRGSVLFRQERIGFLGNRFTCYKFRSMHVDSEETSHQKHLRHLMQSDTPMTKLDAKRDPRVIPMGRLLRASGLDELPQLFNVLHGDMSLIGPRPCLNYEYESFQRWHKMRFHTMPGLTGLWQVSGKNRTTFTEMMRLDVSYAQRHSFRKDLKILAMTVPAVMKQVADLASLKNGKTR